MNEHKSYGNLCKSHSARSEKDFCRVCPSKLNKKELEDVYFSLLENNLDLKRTVNNQQEKIKVLSTKIQRLTTVQKTYLGKEPKQCCGSKAVIVEQKECISELQRSNQCLSERVRQLNMRLCSAKQFLKRSPFQSTVRCNRCSNKTASMSALMTKRSESNLKTAVASSQYLDKDIMSSRTADPEIISHEKGVQYDSCDENKCRTHIEELKQENQHLVEQLSKTNDELTSTISEYELQLSDLRSENIRVRSERTQAEDSIRTLQEEATDLRKRLGLADIRCDELSVELSIEKRKVLELEMRVKAADMSSRIAHAIEAHLTSIKKPDEVEERVTPEITQQFFLNHKSLATPPMVKDSSNVHKSENDSTEMPITQDESPRLIVPSPRFKPKAAIRTKITQPQVEDVFKNSDDSGYTEANKSDNVDDNKAPTYLNQVLLEKIADLQNQINNLKSSKVPYLLLGHNILENYSGAGDSQNTSEKIIQSGKLSEKQKATPLTFEEHMLTESSESVITEKNLGSVISGNSVSRDERKHGRSNQESVASKGISKINSSRETISEDEMSSKDIHDIKIEQHTEHGTEINRKESYKQFKKRSRDKNREVNKLTDSRKFSLQSSRESLIEKKLYKTGSLDENRMLGPSYSEENKKKIGTTDINTKHNTKEISRKEKHDYINKPRDVTDLINKNTHNNVKDDKASKQDDSVVKSKKQNVGSKENIQSRNDNLKHVDSLESKKDINKDSDSSKSTYSIHRDNQIAYTESPKAGMAKGSKEFEKSKENEPKREIIYNILTADFKKNLTNSAVKDILEKRRSSTLSQPRTYVLPKKGKAKFSRELSPDSTEYEISSLSDLPSEKDERASSKYRSPGEELLTTTVSESRTDTTTTDYGSLSEGELPCVGETTVLSAGETRVPNRTVKSHSLPLSTSQQMEEALAMVKQELTRCTTLLQVHARRSLDGPHRISDRV